MATNQNEVLDWNDMFGRGLNKEHFCKTFYQNICHEIAINTFSPRKSMENVSLHDNECT